LRSSASYLQAAAARLVFDGFHLLRRAGYGEAFIDDVARVMEYTKAYDGYRDDRETTAGPSGGS